MLVPLKWLKEYVDIDISPEELADRLTMSGSKVESVRYLGEGIEKVVVGQIKTIEKHPDADNLLMAKVDIGCRELIILTGAKNIAVGQKIPVALDGCTLPIGKEIKDTVIRGIPSQGMMCSAEELGLEPKNFPEGMRDGILILDDGCKLGEDIKQYLGLDDYVIEFEITSNRPDCLSILGIARETAATLGKKLKMPKIPESIGIEGPVKTSVEIIDSDLCHRYVAKIINNVNVKESPTWLKNKLIAAGLRPINNIVDITNYVMLELGQPLHAFDFEKLKEGKIIVRKAMSGEKLTTLDGVERELKESYLMIADGEKPIALAGIMGGEESEVTEKTKTILLESALFNNINIRRTAKNVGLRTDASSRFEKGVDPGGVIRAANRVCQLIEEIGAGQPQIETIDIYPIKEEDKTVEISCDRINSYIGIDISIEEVKGILESLEFEVKGDKNLLVKVPSFRRDVSIEADIIEEVARIYGFDKIPPTLLKGVTTPGKDSKKQSMDNKVKDILAGLGFYEVLTYSFVSSGVFDRINLSKDDKKRRTIQLINPLGEEQSTMRTTLIPNLLEVISRNINRKAEEVSLYELGNIYLPKELPLAQLPDERKTLILGYSGKYDFYHLKGVLETIAISLGLEFSYKPLVHPTFHPYRCAEIFFDGSILGIIGEIHPNVAEKYDINKRIYIAEIDMESLYGKINFVKMYSQLPKYPSVVRDIAFIVEDRILAGDILETIKGASPYIEGIKVFDVYKGSQIKEGFKSMAYSITFRSKDKTLTDKEVKDIMDNLVEELKAKFGITLRE